MVEEGRQTQALKLPFPTGETNKIISPMEAIHREITHFFFLFGDLEANTKSAASNIPRGRKIGVGHMCRDCIFSSQARLIQQSSVRFCCPASAIQLELAGDGSQLAECLPRVQEGPVLDRCTAQNKPDTVVYTCNPGTLGKMVRGSRSYFAIWWFLSLA